MKVLVMHNRYVQTGGEDRVVEDECELLRSVGVEVKQHIVENRQPTNPFSLLQTAVDSPWSAASYREVRRICREFNPDVAHIHNFWMSLTPAAHAACKKSGVATVQTLHNYRLLCANALLFRNGAICEDCLGHFPWRGILHRCYRESFPASAAVVAMIGVNRARGTWRSLVDAYIALSPYSRDKFVSSGFPAEQMFIKPNSAPDPGASALAPSASTSIIYAGRLSAEKGVDDLIDAWSKVPQELAGSLVLIGGGPLSNALQNRAVALGLQHPRITFQDSTDQAGVYAAIRKARAVVISSRVYEHFPRLIVEAFAHGRAVIAPQLGAMNDLVDAEVGVQYAPSDVSGLSTALTRLLARPQLADLLGSNARNRYLATYTPKHNAKALLRIYKWARAASSA
jgi:glycosyltransferase involved in cell wall biosynthesis